MARVNWDGWAAKLAAAMIGLGALGTASAAIYVGTFDPLYGSPFTVAEGARVDLGWRGEIKLDIDDSCLVPNGDVMVDDGCSVDVVYAFAVIYDTDDISDHLRLDFDPSSVDVEKLRFSGGNLTGLQTGFFTNFVSDGGFTYDDYTDEVLFALKFALDDIVGSDTNDDPILYSGALLPAARPTISGCVAGEPCISPDVRAFPPQLVFTPVPPSTVPLPSTTGLALLALAAAGAVRRR